MAFGILPREQFGRVMIVDDEADIRKVVRMHLEKANYEVIEAENGDEAIKLLNAGDNPVYVDTIICDIRMPKINGVDAVAYFRRQYPSLPILILTGFPDVKMATSFLQQGVVDYLVKPVERDVLVNAVKRAVDQHEMFKDQFTV
ncbi:MAG TPA: response regulator [Nitrospirales bacterium]|nr:response regulator [Nitrospirales bacterium]